MAYRVAWSPAALDDVDSIAGYIARDSPRYASTVVEKFRTITRGLRQFPLSGRMVPEFGDERIREKIVYNWRIIYRFEDAVVTIAAIVHSRQSFETGLARVRR